MPFLLINSRTLHFLRCLVPEENTFCWTLNLNPEYLSAIKNQRQISVFTGSFTQCIAACVGLPEFFKKWIWIHATSSQSSVRCVCLQQQCIIQQSHCHSFRCWQGRYLKIFLIFFFNLWGQEKWRDKYSPTSLWAMVTFLLFPFISLLQSGWFGTNSNTWKSRRLGFL